MKLAHDPVKNPLNKMWVMTYSLGTNDLLNIDDISTYLGIEIDTIENNYNIIVIICIVVATTQRYFSWCILPYSIGGFAIFVYFKQYML